MLVNAHEEMMKVYNMLGEANHYMIQLRLKYELFSWRWWLQIVLFVGPWILWVKFRKKESSDRLLYAGFSVMISSAVLDTLGAAYGLWAYKWKLIPFYASLIPWDFSLIPVAVMFTLQLNPFKLNRYVQAVIFSAGSSFIIEPLFVLLDYYVPSNWKYIYSFPITIIIYLIADWISRREKFERL
jgi:hypothetical protein